MSKVTIENKIRKKEEGAEYIGFNEGELRAFIFNEILPEVLQSVLPKNLDPRKADCELRQCWAEGRNDYASETKKKAKELYNIDLNEN